ncbi:MAG TPA: OsmC family protein [Gemmatimonadaceae bacterium]|nr:OsmC family protein [Gemmatimonadaceae bacterium]
MTISIRTEELRAFGTPAGDGDGAFTLTLDASDGYRQVADFQLEGVDPVVLDEPLPLGAGTGPNPARVLGAAVGGCLGASLLYCLRKARVDVRGLHTTVRGTLKRNERGRLRVGGIFVRLEPLIPQEQHERVARCLPVFEDFCIVTASIRPAVSVEVEVRPASA